MSACVLRPCLQDLAVARQRGGVGHGAALAGGQVGHDAAPVDAQAEKLRRRGQKVRARSARSA